MFKNLTVAGMMCLCAVSAFSSENTRDSLATDYDDVTDTLAATVVAADRYVPVSRVDTVRISVPGGMGEMIQQIPGIHLNDYGGLPGQKTIIIRGMSPGYADIRIDGVKVNETKSGQIDLGLLGMEGVDAVNVDYVRGRVNLVTAKPVFEFGKNFSGKVSFSGGSFGTYVPAARFNWRVGERVVMSAYGRGTFYKGDFKYADPLSESGDVWRDNNDMKQGKAGLDVFGDLKDGSGDWRVKAYFNAAERGCPGAVTYLSEDRQKDMNTFVQGSFRRNVNDWYSAKLTAKVAFDRLVYRGWYGTDQYENDYRQKDIQINADNNFRVSRVLAFDADAHFGWTGLDSDNYNAYRASAETRVAAVVNLEKFKAEASANYIGAFDKGAARYNCFTPLLALRFLPTKWLSVTASGRRAYRVPDFNELYYAGIGNPDLKPEDAWMTEAGISAKTVAEGGWSFEASADGYFNYLKDKIISAPTEDPFIWMMYNLETAKIYGLDASAGSGFKKGDWNCGLNVRYTLEAGTKIPYHSKHRTVVNVTAGFRGWRFAAMVNAHSLSTDAYGVDIPAWTTVDATLSKSLKYFTFSIMGKNIFNCRYEMVPGYPMPGASIMGGVEYRF